MVVSMPPAPCWNWPDEGSAKGENVANGKDGECVRYERANRTATRDTHEPPLTHSQNGDLRIVYCSSAKCGNVGEQMWQIVGSGRTVPGGG